MSNEQLRQHFVILFYGPLHATPKGTASGSHSLRVVSPEDRVCIEIMKLEPVVPHPCSVGRDI